MKMQVIASGLGFVEGPVWHDDTLWFTQIDDATVSKVDGWDGDRNATGTSVVAETGGGPNGMTLGPDGVFYVANNGGAVHDTHRRPAAIQRLEGGTATDLVTKAGDVELRACNDLCFGPDGRLYFTDPANSPMPPLEHPCHVCRVDLETGRAEVLHTGLQYPNGIGFHPDGDRLIVAETFGASVHAFPWSADGLGEPELYCQTSEPAAAPDGFCFDEEGRLYVAGTLKGEVQVFDRDGNLVDQLAVGEGTLPTNACFGGPDMTTLYVTDSAVLEPPGHGQRDRQRLVAYDIGVRGLPLFTGD